jgi:hypothetical protein
MDKTETQLLKEILENASKKVDKWPEWKRSPETRKQINSLNIKLDEKPKEKQMKNNSTCINKYFYDFRNKTLFVSFASGKTYAYYNVSKGTYLNLRRAKSVGSFVSRFVKPSHDVLLIQEQ